jgi:hypothetical protein
MKRTINTEVSAAVAAVPTTRRRVGFAESAQSTQANSKAGITAIAYAITIQSRRFLNPSGAVNTTNARGGKRAPKIRKRFMTPFPKSLGLTYRCFRSTGSGA